MTTYVRDLPLNDDNLEFCIGGVWFAVDDPHGDCAISGNLQ